MDLIDDALKAGHSVSSVGADRSMTAARAPRVQPPFRPAQSRFATTPRLWPGRGRFGSESAAPTRHRDRTACQRRQFG